MSLFNEKPLDRKLSHVLVDLTLVSCWSQKYHSVDIPLYELLDTLSRYGDKGLGKGSTLELQDLIPEWQMCTDKWTESTQKSFLEHILLGYRDATITLYTLTADYKLGGYNKCKVLDGLQKCNAIGRFMQDGLSVFDDLSKSLGYPPLTFSVLSELTAFVGVNKTVKVHIYKFESDLDALSFFIQSNRDVSPSVYDLDRAAEIYQRLLAESKDTTGI
jgi:hypothetical protein